MDSQPIKEEVEFFNDLINQKPGSLGFQLSTVMKDQVKEDQGRDPLMNSAVYSVLAAIIKHKGLTETAMNIAKMDEPPEQKFVSLWKFAQSLRSWIGKGTSDVAAIEAAAKNVRDRASFLIAVYPATVDTNKARAAPAKPTIGHWGSVLKTLKSTNSVSSSKLQRSNSASKWAALLDEAKAKAIEDLTSLLEFQKINAARATKSDDKDTSIQGQIMSFVKSDFSLDNLKKAMKERDGRASQRIEGLNLFDSILRSEIKNPDNLKMLFHAWKSSLAPSATKSDSTSKSPSIHFLQNLEGCNSSNRQKVTGNFGIILEIAGAVLGNKMFDISVHVAVLEALTLSYNLEDADLLHHSGIIPIISRNLTRDDALAHSTWQFFRVVAARLVGEN
jgi:hypothetical protein